MLAACGGGAATTTTSAPTSATTTTAPSTTMAEETTTTAAPVPLAEALGCHGIQVVVPYSAGGGSDQQVRRLQPAIEALVGDRLNVTYQTGGDGSVGWNALANSDPDGCTIGNVVAPNIMNLSLQGQDVGFKAEDFSYFGWTEYSPNIIAVAPDSKWQTIEDFIAEAMASPGKITISGVGINGELLMGEVEAATGIDLAFVPVSGGVGEIIPQIAGHHIDAAISGFSLLDGDQVRPLVLSAPSAKFPDLPTFEEAGYANVKLVTSWGLALPPGTPEDIIAMWNDVLEQALADPGVMDAYAQTGFTVLYQNVDEARQYFATQYTATETALNAIK
ncbi:MAG: tripartite tricarboxylate transporter substrate binding protein [Actinomycetota bacterium]|nr:tripartite tricarboxylate transporter substrate binding protein [Actinomycetota bacterium]